MAKTFDYVTMQGDTFDMLALVAYNSESKASLIIQENPRHASVLIFDAGITIKIPMISKSAAATLPPWMR